MIYVKYVSDIALKSVKMKICIVTYEFPPAIYGGAGVYIHNIALGLAEKGHEIHVIHSGIYGSIDLHENITSYPMHVGPIKALHIPMYWIVLFFKFNEIKRKIGDFDIIIGNGYSEFALIKRFSSAKRILIMHQSSKNIVKMLKPSSLERLRYFNTQIGAAPFFDEIIIHRADHIVVVSQYLKSIFISEYGLNEKDVSVVYNGTNDSYVPMNEEDKEVIRHNVGVDEKIIILFVGRITEPLKNFSLMLTTFKKLLQKLDAALLVAGPGRQEDYKHMAKKLGIEQHVIFLGWLDHHELSKMYTLCDVYVSTSLFESFGLSLVEAMSANKPVIAKNMKSLKEVVTSENGILYGSYDEETISDAIVEVVTNEQWHERTSRNREYVLNIFSWERSVIKFDEILNHIAKK